MSKTKLEGISKNKIRGAREVATNYPLLYKRGSKMNEGKGEGHL